MSDFLDRLAARALGVVPLVRPLIPSHTTPTVAEPDLPPEAEQASRGRVPGALDAWEAADPPLNLARPAQSEQPLAGTAGEPRTRPFEVAVAVDLRAPRLPDLPRIASSSAGDIPPIAPMAVAPRVTPLPAPPAQQPDQSTDEPTLAGSPMAVAPPPPIPHRQTAEAAATRPPGARIVEPLADSDRASAAPYASPDAEAGPRQHANGAEAGPVRHAHSRRKVEVSPTQMHPVASPDSGSVEAPGRQLETNEAPVLPQSVRVHPIAGRKAGARRAPGGAQRDPHEEPPAPVYDVALDPSREQPRPAHPPTIHVTIGTVEVRAVAQPAMPMPEWPHPGPKLSLDEYLEHRSRRHGG
jgi:hypothetical protein